MNYIELWQTDLRGHKHKYDANRKIVLDLRSVDIGFHSVEDVKEMQLGYTLHLGCTAEPKPAKGHVLARVAENGLIAEIVSTNYDGS